jgi:two-component system LytT family sensor kinase
MEKNPSVIGSRGTKTFDLSPATIHDIKTWRFLSIVFLLVGLAYWLPSYLDTDSRFRVNLQLQVILNYMLLSGNILIIYWVFFRNTTGNVNRLLLKHLITLPLYISMWLFVYNPVYKLLGGKYVYGDMGGNNLYLNTIYCDIYLPGLVYLLYFVFLHLFHYYHYQKQQLAIENKLMSEAYRNETNLLKTKIQPHVLFHSLNVITTSIPEELVHTRSLISRLIDNINFTMNTAQKEFILLKEEVTFIRSYLELERERFTDRLELHFDISPDALDVYIPPMLFQPIVENALKHGIEKKIEGGSISLKITRQPKLLNVEIADTGIGIDPALKNIIFEKGIGLKNTRLRLKKLFGEDIHIKHNIPSGTVVYFNIPLQGNESK